MFLFLSLFMFFSFSLPLSLFLFFFFFEVGNEKKNSRRVSSSCKYFHIVVCVSLFSNSKKTSQGEGERSSQLKVAKWTSFCGLRYQIPVRYLKNKISLDDIFFCSGFSRP